MIRRRALVSLKHHHHHHHQAHQSSRTSISRFSSSSSFTSPKPSPALLFSNQRRFSARCLVPFSSSAAAPWDSSSSGVFCGVRRMSTRMMMNKDSSNRPPKETILLDGCDFEHWLVVMDPPDPNLTRDDIIDGYIKTLAQIVGSEEEARKSMYSVSTRHYFAFSCIVSEEVSYKIKELPKVRWVLPDSYLDVRNKNYGGEPFIDGQPVPYDPKYHEEWLRNYNNSQTKKIKDRRGDRTSTVRGRGGNTIYRHMAPSAPSPAPNPIAHAPMSRPNQNFTPAANYQNQVPPPPPMPNRDFSNMGVLPPGPRTDPSQMQNPDYQRRDMPPQGQNSYFTNKNTPVQNQDFQSNYAQPPTQNCDFQSRDVSSMRNMESPGRNIPLPPTQGQHWNSPSKDMQPPLQNQSNLLPSMQNRHFENRGMPPMQKPEFPNGSAMPPVQKPGFQNAANMSPPMQNWGMPNPAQNPGFQNVPSSNFHMPPRVENPNSQFRHTGNVPPGYQQNRDINMGVMPNNQNREIPSFTKSVNMQNRDYQGQGMPGFTNSVNMQNRDYQGRDMPSNSNSQNAHNIDQQAWGSSQNTSNGGSEALANRNF